MENLGDVTMRVFVPNREGDPLFSPTLSELNSTISGVFSPEQTILLTARQYYFEMRSTFQGREVTLINGAIEAKDATDGIGVTDAVSDVTIDLASQVVDVELGDSATIALQAAADSIAARDISIAEALRSEQEADRSFAEADRAQAEADRIEGTVSVVNFDDDWYELVAILPAQLVDETVTLNGVEIQIVDIILP